MLILYLIIFIYAFIQLFGDSVLIKKGLLHPLHPSTQNRPSKCVIFSKLPDLYYFTELDLDWNWKQFRQCVNIKQHHQ